MIGNKYCIEIRPIYFSSLKEVNSFIKQSKNLTIKVLEYKKGKWRLKRDNSK